jgi:hypothetical protein
MHLDDEANSVGNKDTALNDYCCIEDVIFITLL